MKRETKKVTVAQLDARLYSISDAADVLGICTSKMWGLIREDKIPSVALDKRKFVSPCVLQSILNGEFVVKEG